MFEGFLGFRNLCLIQFWWRLPFKITFLQWLNLFVLFIWLNHLTLLNWTKVDLCYFKDLRFRFRRLSDMAIRPSLFRVKLFPLSFLCSFSSRLSESSMGSAGKNPKHEAKWAGDLSNLTIDLPVTLSFLPLTVSKSISLQSPKVPLHSSIDLRWKYT